MVTCRSETCASTRTWSRTRSGTLARHHRWTRAISISGNPMPVVCTPSRCDVDWNSPFCLQDGEIADSCTYVGELAVGQARHMRAWDVAVVAEIDDAADLPG